MIYLEDRSWQTKDSLGPLYKALLILPGAEVFFNLTLAVPCQIFHDTAAPCVHLAQERHNKFHNSVVEGGGGGQILFFQKLFHLHFLKIKKKLYSLKKKISVISGLFRELLKSYKRARCISSDKCLLFPQKWSFFFSFSLSPIIWTLYNTNSA